MEERHTAEGMNFEKHLFLCIMNPIFSSCKQESSEKSELQIGLCLVFPTACLSSERFLHSSSTHLNSLPFLTENPVLCLQFRNPGRYLAVIVVPLAI